MVECSLVQESMVLCEISQDKFRIACYSKSMVLFWGILLVLVSSR